MTLRIGVLGFAHYHANFWCEAFQADRRVTVTGIWDHDAGRAAAAAARFGTMATTDLDALLDRVDAVAITSETVRHRPLAEHALARRLPILCEKPLATTLADAQAIAGAAEQAGTPFVQSFPKRLDPAHQELRQMVGTGALGAIRLARIRHGHDHGRDDAFTAGWWADPALSGGGTLLDEGVHAADLLLWLFGPPVRVQATLGHAGALPVEDVATAIFEWDSQLVAEVSTSWRFRAGHDSVEAYGDDGTALLAGVDLASRVPAGGGPYLRISRGAAWAPSPVVPTFVSGGFHQNVARSFVDTLLDGAPPVATAADGLAAQILIHAAYVAARLGRRTSCVMPMQAQEATSGR